MMSKIGAFNLYKIEAGRLGLDGGAMFGIVPKTLWTKHIEPDDRNRIPLNMRCLLLESSDRLILIDNGLGSKYDDRFADLYAIEDEKHNLNDSLANFDFSVSDVTDVILTHLHFDHCGGSTQRVGDRVEVAFPNATFHVQRGHWEWANESNVRERASFLAENIQPLADSSQLNLVEGRIELFPGVELLPVDGHTKEMQLVRVHDEMRSLLYMADLVPTHAHFSPAWNMAYDLWPMTTIEEKGKLLQEAFDGDWTLFFEHDPGVEIADVDMTERGAKVKAMRRFDEL